MLFRPKALNTPASTGFARSGLHIFAFLASILTASGAAGEICVKSPFGDPQTDAHGRLIRLYQDTAQTLESFPSLHQSFTTRSPELCYARQLDGAHGYLDAEGNRIYIAVDLPADMQMGILLHELRHLDQIEIGACPSDELAMADYARATFAMEADASAISLLVAWHLKTQGQPAVWAALSSWDSQSDIADRFASEMSTTGNLESAVSAAFEQWYASDRRRAQYYLATCSAYLDRQDATHALPQYLALPTDFYADLCKLPDGTGYPCLAPDQALR